MARFGASYYDCYYTNLMLIFSFLKKVFKVCADCFSAQNSYYSVTTCTQK